MGVPRGLLLPCYLQLSLSLLCLAHLGKRRHELGFFGDLTFPPPSGWRQSRAFLLRRGQPFFPSRRLALGMSG
jgi:hypothetical protein